MVSHGRTVCGPVGHSAPCAREHGGLKYLIKPMENDDFLRQGVVQILELQHVIWCGCHEGARTQFA